VLIEGASGPRRPARDVGTLFCVLQSAAGWGQASRACPQPLAQDRPPVLETRESAERTPPLLHGFVPPPGIQVFAAEQGTVSRAKHPWKRNLRPRLCPWLRFGRRQTRLLRPERVRHRRTKGWGSFRRAVREWPFRKKRKRERYEASIRGRLIGSVLGFGREGSPRAMGDRAGARDTQTHGKDSRWPRLLSTHARPKIQLAAVYRDAWHIRRVDSDGPNGAANRIGRAQCMTLELKGGKIGVA